MKCSKINAEIKHMEELIKAHGFEILHFVNDTGRLE